MWQLSDRQPGAPALGLMPCWRWRRGAQPPSAGRPGCPQRSQRWGAGSGRSGGRPPPAPAGAGGQGQGQAGQGVVGASGRSSAENISYVPHPHPHPHPHVVCVSAAPRIWCNHITSHHPSSGGRQRTHLETWWGVLWGFQALPQGGACVQDLHRCAPSPGPAAAEHLQSGNRSTGRGQRHKFGQLLAGVPSPHSPRFHVPRPHAPPSRGPQMNTRQRPLSKAPAPAAPEAWHPRCHRRRCAPLPGPPPATAQSPPPARGVAGQAR